MGDTSNISQTSTSLVDRSRVTLAGDVITPGSTSVDFSSMGGSAAGVAASVPWEAVLIAAIAIVAILIYGGKK
jgi:hypothetical protein